MSLKNLNDIAIDQQPTKNNDWLQVRDLGSGKYHFGFWKCEVRNTQAGQQSLNFKGVSRTGLFDILAENGYCKRYRENGTYILIRNINNVLELVTPAQIKDFALELVDSLPEQVPVLGFIISAESLKETFLSEHHILFGENTLSPLKTHTDELLSDKSNKMYFPYQNGVAAVTADKIELIPYADLKDICIWKDHILKRDFVATDERSMYADFVDNVSSNDPERINAMRCAIGYALHRHYTQTNTKAIILYDEQIVDANEAQGGTGKGVKTNALSYMREVETIDGKKYDGEDKFALQRVTEKTQIVFFDDVRPGFDFERFNSILTDGWEVEAKNKTTVRFPLQNSPKMIISSNSIMKCKDGNTAERRQFVLEFSDFYSKLKHETSKPIVFVHGCEFFYDWNQSEWSKFDNYMLESCKIYLKNGLPIVKNKNVAYNRLLQSTSSDFVNWTTETDFKTFTDYPFNKYFLDFKSLYYGENTNYSQHVFRTWLKLYCKVGGFEFKSHRFNAITYFRFE